MSANEVVLILLVHWIADFIFQDECWAQNKCQNFAALLKHTLTYSFIWLLMMFMFLPLLELVIFVTGTFLFHTLTDFITSKIVSKKFKCGKYGSKIPNFGAFSIIGLDQLLHFTQLIYLYEFLK